MKSQIGLFALALSLLWVIVAGVVLIPDITAHVRMHLMVRDCDGHLNYLIEPIWPVRYRAMAEVLGAPFLVVLASWRYATARRWMRAGALIFTLLSILVVLLATNALLHSPKACETDFDAVQAEPQSDT